MFRINQGNYTLLLHGESRTVQVIDRGTGNVILTQRRETIGTSTSIRFNGTQKISIRVEEALRYNETVQTMTRVPDDLVWQTVRVIREVVGHDTRSYRDLPIGQEAFTAFVSEGNASFNLSGYSRNYFANGKQIKVMPYHGSRNNCPAWVRDESIDNGNVVGFGFEIEVDHPEGKTANTERLLLKAIFDSGLTPADVRAEQDASVTYEIVCNSFTKAWFEVECGENGRLTKLCDLLTRAGFVSEQGGRCGLHCHVSRAALPEDAPEKLQALIYNNEEMFIKLSRRNKGAMGYCSLDGNKFSSRSTYEQIRNNLPGGHYTALNVNNAHTLELRFWRGTLNVTRIWQQVNVIQGMVNLIYKSRLETLAVGMTLEKFLAPMSPTAREYINERMGAN